MTSETVRVIELVAEGLTDEQIARKLGVGRATVQRRLKGAADLLGAKSRVNLVVKALDAGILTRTVEGTVGEANASPDPTGGDERKGEPQRRPSPSGGG